MKICERDLSSSDLVMDENSEIKNQMEIKPEEESVFIFISAQDNSTLKRFLGLICRDQSFF